MRKAGIVNIVKRSIGLAAAGVLVACTAATSAADNDGPNFTFGASTSYTYDIDDPDTSTGENEKLYSSFEQDESFNIDLVQIGASGTRGPVSYGAKIDFGDLAKQVQDNLDDNIALQEMYLVIDTGFATVTAGRMPTPIGYEVLEPWADPNISRSRAFTFQPVNHDGLAVSGEIGNVNGMIGAANGFNVTDPNINNPDDEYAILGSLGAAVGDLDLRLAGIYSRENDNSDRWEVNAVAAGNYENYRYGLESTYFGLTTDADPGAPPDSSMWDITGYGGATWGDWSVDLRASYTDEMDGTNGNLYAGADGNHIWSFTVTPGYEITDGVVLRAEYRIDVSDEDVFADNDTTSSGPDNLDHVVMAQLMWTPATGDK